MQSYSCTAGETCVGTPYRTELTCDCGGKTCSTVIPLLPIPLIVGPPLDIAPPVPIDPPELSGSSSSSASACSATTISIPDDFLSTLSYWEAQFPFTLPTSTTSSTITSTSQSKVTTTAAFSSDTSAAQAFSSSLTSESASRASSVAAAEATQKCQHWEAQSYSGDIPQEWWPPISESDKGYLCMAEPSKMDVNNYTWGENWRYQHFSVDNGWDEDHPDVTLVEHFCQTLVDNSVDVTYDGGTQGACAPYGRGDCLREENGQCGMYQHNVAAANGATVVFAVTYKTNSAKCGDEHNKPTYYPDMGVDACVKKLNEHLIDKCKFTKKPKSYNLYELFPVLGGVFWDGCMQYWIVATKNPLKVSGHSVHRQHIEQAHEAGPKSRSINALYSKTSCGASSDVSPDLPSIGCCAHGSGRQLRFPISMTKDLWLYNLSF